MEKRYKENSKQKMRNDVEKQLFCIIEKIFQNKIKIKEKAIKSLKRIEENHNVTQYANKLLEIYKESI